MKTANYIWIGILMLTLQTTYAQKAQLPQSGSGETILIKDPATNCSYRYYYYPNLFGYYDAQKNEYILKVDNQWQRLKEIPNGYMGYSLNNKFNVLITDYDDEDVTQFIKVHKKKYPYNFHQKVKQVSSNE